jgi:RNA polymerase sigma-70 factor (ECF subfamily)
VVTDRVTASAGAARSRRAELDDLGDERQRALVAAFVSAWERADVDGIVALRKLIVSEIMSLDGYFDGPGPRPRCGCWSRAPGPGRGTSCCATTPARPDRPGPHPARRPTTSRYS